MLFRQEAYDKVMTKKLRLGYLCYKDSKGEIQFGIENLPLSKASTRVIKTVKEKLEALGHELVPFEVTQGEYEELIDTYIGFAKTASIPSFHDLEKRKHEYLMPFYRLFSFIAGCPQWFKSFAAWFLRTFTSEKRLAKRLVALRNRDYNGVNALHQSWDAWRVRFDEKWAKAGLDGCISPC